MKLAIVGAGYVGLVSAACLADVGHQVVCIDNDKAKINRLCKGELDIFEPGLASLIKHSNSSDNLIFADSIEGHMPGLQAVMIAVGTPPDELGNTKLDHVMSVAKSIGQTMQQQLLVICKSTAPVGTCDSVRQVIAEQLEVRDERFRFEVVSNPEFLKEGSAVSDFMRPDRIIVGCDSEWAMSMMRELYAPFNRNHDRIIQMSVRSSELSKYAANVMLANKISFINEMANIAERVGADIEEVRHGIGSDPRIGYDFIYAGCGYGGSCFPKDVSSLLRTAENQGYQSGLIAAIDEVNQRQKRILLDKLLSYFSGDVDGKKIAVWGLAFKPNTDDVREAPSRVALDYLLENGASVRAFDPVASAKIANLYDSYSNLELLDSKEEAIKEADALMIFTEWKAFKVLDYELVHGQMASPVIFDGRNLYDPRQMIQHGFRYFAIGRGEQPGNLS